MNERPTAIIALIFMMVPYTPFGLPFTRQPQLHLAAAAPTREGNQPQPRMVAVRDSL